MKQNVKVLARTYEYSRVDPSELENYNSTFDISKNNEEAIASISA